jgi:hypothetical protein
MQSKPHDEMKLGKPKGKPSKSHAEAQSEKARTMKNLN